MNAEYRKCVILSVMLWSSSNCDRNIKAFGVSEITLLEIAITSMTKLMYISTGQSLIFHLISLFCRVKLGLIPNFKTHRDHNCNRIGCIYIIYSIKVFEHSSNSDHKVKPWPWLVSCAMVWLNFWNVILKTIQL